MHLGFVLLIIAFGYLRKTLQSKTLLPHWDKFFYWGLILTIAFFVMQFTLPQSGKFTVWIVHALIFYLIYLSYTQKEFLAAKSILVAIMPMAIVNFLEDVTTLISPSFYDKWNGYFETAGVFALIWLIAMWIINNRQRKALLKEKLKADEKEKEFRITESLKAALEVQVAERTAELMGQKEQLQKTLDELTSTQAQLIHAEKMASLGELTAGIAHEIQNPLNFVNNFSEVNAELIDELEEEINKGNLEEVKALAKDIRENEIKINHHGKRADSIVKGMLQHSRSSTGVKEPADINKLADEYLRLAYHGLRAKDKTFNATMKTEYDESIGNIPVVPQDIGRVILNLITNAFYAVTEKKNMASAQAATEKYEPIVTVGTKRIKDRVEIKVKDNGNGIPSKVMDKIFQPFFTTKPSGEGTGLGLSMSYDIVTKAHGGELKVQSTEGAGAEFIISLPV
jgi:two-component system NtrC family sensor kinase